MRYSNDVDLLHWEPNLFRDGSAVGQLLLSASASVDGTHLSLSAPATTAGLRAGHVAVIEGSVAGTYPIVAVPGAQALTISVLYDGLYPPDGGPAVPLRAGPVTAAGQTVSVHTFDAQQRLAADLVLRSIGLEPADVAAGRANVFNATALRRPCVLGALQLVYSALAAVAEQPEVPQVRADLYERLFRQSLRGLSVEVDADGDGRAEPVRHGALVAMRRA